MRVVDIAQRTPEWLDWRKGGVSATSLAVIMGYHPDKTRRQLWLELKGYAQPADLSSIPQVRQGAKLEPLALQAFEQQYGKIGLPICAEHDEHSFIRASFDGLMDRGIPVEIKNLAENNHLQVLEHGIESSFYQLYQWQVKHQLVVSGASRGYLWFWSPKHTPVLLEVRLSDGEREEIIDICADFWAQVENDEIPDADPDRDPLPMEELSPEQRQKWSDLATQRRELEKKIKEAKSLLSNLTAQGKALEEEFLDVMGAFSCADADGVRITQYQIQGKVNWEQVARSLDPNLSDEVINRHRGLSTSGIKVSVNPDFTPAQAPAPIPITRGKRKKKTESVQQVAAFWI